jgi:hypothetical protein
MRKQALPAERSVEFHHLIIRPLGDVRIYAVSLALLIPAAVHSQRHFYLAIGKELYFL